MIFLASLLEEGLFCPISAAFLESLCSPFQARIPRRRKQTTDPTGKQQRRGHPALPKERVSVLLSTR